MKFKVWCKNNNEWEKHDVLLNQDGDLFHIKLGGALLPLRPDTHIPVFFSGKTDKNGNEINTGSIIRLIDDTGSLIKVVCEFGTARRDIYGNTVDITGFYFRRLTDGKKTFPIVNNYAGKHDLELFEVIGNIYENPELLEES